MHYHLEIVMPHTDDVKADVKSVLEPFDENGEDRHNSFWDFWVIGGRFAGVKLMSRYDHAKIEEFYAWLKSEKITVSSLICGKQELSPASQIPKVDTKWQEMFPSDPPIPCPIFQHSNNQYGEGKNSQLPSDVAKLSDVPKTLEMSRIIIAVPRLTKLDTPSVTPEAAFMLTQEQWNGVNHMPVAWDGTLGTALDMWQKHMERYRTEEYKNRVSPKGDWLVVTVDYHS